jgi:hypothetical protein
VKKFVLVCCAYLFSCCAFAQVAPGDAALRQQVAAFVDEWHDDAAHARPAFFDKMAKDGIYIGTDKTENWRRDAFKAWSKRFFDRGTAWTFKATQRNIYFSEDKKFIWFDELLASSMGTLQASGVIRRSDKGLEIEHYQLSLAVPNEISDHIIKQIKEFENKSATK